LSREEAYAQVDGPPISDSRERDGDGGAFYQYCRQHGHWPLAVSGWDPHSEVEVRNVTDDYPPTILIHGTADTDVPYEQSTMMAEQFAEHGVEHHLLTIENGEHGLQGGDPDEIENSYEFIESFVLSKVR
jgi:acetyl esterase/lipase